MDYSFYLNKNTPDDKKLISYGFISENGVFVYKKDLTENELYAVISVSRTNISARVIDRDYGDDYLPFDVKDSDCAAKAEVGRLLEDIIEKCFSSVDLKDEVEVYLHSTYGSVAERPWAKYPDYRTFKTRPVGKWYAVIMTVKQNSLGLDGDNIVDIVNVKVNPNEVEKLVDNVRYFYAYHMNKRNWITILLDKNTDRAKLKSLLSASYSLVD